MVSASGALALLVRPGELYAAVKLKQKIKVWKKRAAAQKKDADWVFCFDMLNKVSRSFAIVIEQLGDELRNAVCVFYLVLRGLDTVEDDMAIDKETKTRLLLDFHNAIERDGFTLSYGYKDEKILLEKFDHVVRAYRSLKPQYRETIKDITRRMAEGMMLFTTKKVVTKKDYDLYCHYVAGLVGIGLSHLFSGSGLEDPAVAESEETANHMGLFLQKTNIIRDFLEDHEDVNEDTGDRRVFWPKEIWGKYTDDLADFTFGKNETQAVACLNDMVTDALQHLPYCIEYLSSIRDESNFLFCAIPQVMAAHTLSLCYANGEVFKGEVRKQLGECRNTRPVKIRKGLSARLMLEAKDMDTTMDILEDAVESIADRIAPADPSALHTKAHVQTFREVLLRARRSSSPSSKARQGDSWATEAYKSAEWMADSFLMPLMGLLLTITCLVDVPDVLGLSWFTKHMPAGAHVGMGAPLPVQRAVVAWAVMFYSTTMTLVAAGKGRDVCKMLAVCHMLVSAVEVAAVWTAGRDGGAIGGYGRQLLSEALPKVLAASCLLIHSAKPKLSPLTPSHHRVVRVQPVRY
jgi:farnesyl-diphosphate farnesyltransferase